MPNKLIKNFHLGNCVEKVRACPICPNCGSKKFDRIKSEETVVRCVNCGKEMSI